MLNVVSNYAYVLLTAEDITGEPINDAVYNRNVAVGDKLNVSFSENIVGWNDIGPAITNMVMSDEYTYDIVFDESQSCIKYPAKKILSLSETRCIWLTEISTSCTAKAHGCCSSIRICSTS